MVAHAGHLRRLFGAAARRAARLLPDAARSYLKERLRPRVSSPPATPGVNLIGYVRSEHGVGESVRSAARAAAAADIPFALVDFNTGNAARTHDDTWTACLSQAPRFGVNLCHVNADQTPLLHATLGRRYFDQRYTIGYWAWELPEFPAQWLGSFALVDEVWTPSQFVADAISRRAPVPVVRMPHCIEFELRREARRSDFGLPADRFLFLMMYDTQSFQERKNPEGALDAYRRAFPSQKDVGLVVKINHPQSYPEKVRELKTKLADVPGVFLIDRTLTRQEVYDLEGQCDAFVSLHRAEGFGLGMAEAMFLGKPVVATHWSGNLDFMTVGNSCPVAYHLMQLAKDIGPYQKGQTWAEPDVEHAAWHMRRLVEDARLRRTIGERGRETIRTQFSPAAVGRLYRQRLELLALARDLRTAA
jgi:glycosyltransferase involved in cell wall biosynthesis